ncbi:MAG TPA: radical SAM protein [Thermodesulfovibrionales bacterium]|nr:radical SAM protein [Thermodesulfovibrionales bacterium]
MKVCEIFSSIQGESTYAGVPCTFVRMTGCNLRCSYCDTVYAYDEGTELTEDEVVDKIDAIGLRTVEITGGEPLLQEGISILIERLLDMGYRVLIETNGSRDISGVDARAVIILDVKTPGSSMSDTLLTSNLSHLKGNDEAKFVITDRRDYEWAKAFVEEQSLARRCEVLFSPAFGMLDPKELSKWIICDRLDVRLNLQLHKYIYGPELRGV